MYLLMKTSFNEDIGSDIRRAIGVFSSIEKIDSFLDDRMKTVNNNNINQTIKDNILSNVDNYVHISIGEYVHPTPMAKINVNEIMIEYLKCKRLYETKGDAYFDEYDRLKTKIKEANLHNQTCNEQEEINIEKYNQFINKIREEYISKLPIEFQNIIKTNYRCDYGKREEYYWFKIELDSALDEKEYYKGGN